MKKLYRFEMKKYYQSIISEYTYYDSESVLLSNVKQVWFCVSPTPSLTLD